MDMNAGYGGFAAALIDKPLWVMSVVPINLPDTLRVVFDRGLIGIYHDWCKAFNTYPQTYDLLHTNYLFGNLTKRCDIEDVVVEMDRIMRLGGWFLVLDIMETVTKLTPILCLLHWETTLYEGKGDIHRMLTSHKCIIKMSYRRVKDYMLWRYRIIVCKVL